MSICIASFFSGIGGLELGLEAALDAETVFQCERDPYARSVLERHWPGVPRSDDITALRGDGDIPQAEVWCGGFPCQDISVAGRMEGIRGERSGLFFEWMRLVRAVRPRYVVMENVPAILAGENLGPVLGALAEAGYDAEWDVLGAWQVGAPHRRDRWFLIGWDANPGRIRVQGPFAGEDIGGWRQRREGRAPTLHHGPGRWNGRPRSYRPGRSELLGVDDGLPAWLERVRCLGNAVAPQCAYVIGLRLRDIMAACQCRP